MVNAKGTLYGAVVALVSAGLGLAMAFGVHLTATERDAVIAFVSSAMAVAPLVGALLDHGKAQAASRAEAAQTASSATMQAATLAAQTIAKGQG